MVIAEVKEIFIKYKAQEEKIENILIRNRDVLNNGTPLSNIGMQAPILSLEDAKKRNQRLLKELKLVKGNLRSKSIFSPTELQWEKLCEQYKNNPSLPVTTWHCHLPVFV